MPNVKLLLTPYKFQAGDAVQTVFNRQCSQYDFLVTATDVFSSHWQPGLNLLQDQLMDGIQQGWFRHCTVENGEYEAVRTIGVYEGVREPSLCIDLNLVDQTHARDLIRVAAEFGRRFKQTSVHVLFSLQEEEAQIAWNNNQQVAARGGSATVHLAIFNTSVPAQTILDEARRVDIDALTIHFLQHQLQYHHRVCALENEKWNNLMLRLRAQGHSMVEQTWEAMLFAIGDGRDCTSHYSQWRINGVRSAIRSRARWWNYYLILPIV